MTNGLGITRPRRRLTQRSRKNATSRNEQSRMAYISGPASWMIFRKSVVGMKARDSVGGGRRIGRFDRRDGGRRRGVARSLHGSRDAHAVRHMLAVPAAGAGSRKDGFCRFIIHDSHVQQRAGICAQVGAGSCTATSRSRQCICRINEAVVQRLLNGVYRVFVNMTVASSFSNSRSRG